MNVMHTKKRVFPKFNAMQDMLNNVLKTMSNQILTLFNLLQEFKSVP